jgi:hypothetical protein
LTAPFGDPVNAAKLMAAVTSESEQINALSEKDVINVLELVLHEYPVDQTSMFLTGHSMGSGGTWYIGGKYRNYWKALAPMSGPFVQETGYPWDSLRTMPIFVTEGTQTPSLDASHKLRDWMKANGCNLEYKDVNADHGGMIKLVLPDIYDFFDRCRSTTAIFSKQPESFTTATAGFQARYQSQQLQITLPNRIRFSSAQVSVVNMFGKSLYSGTVSTLTGQVCLNDIRISSGVYFARVLTSAGYCSSAFTVEK